MVTYMDKRRFLLSHKIVDRIFIIMLAVLLMITACNKAPTPAPGGPTAPAPVQAQEQPTLPPGAPAPAGNQIALPNGKTVPWPEEAITFDNLKAIDTLGLWKLSGQVNNVLFSPDGKTAYAAVGTPKTSDKGQIYRWRLDDPQGPQVMQETQGAVNALFFSPDNRYLVYGTQGNELVLYDLQADKAGQNLLNTGKGVTAAAWSPTEDMLAWGIFEDYPYFQYLNGTQSGKFGYRLGTTTGLAFAPDGKEIFMAREDGSVFVVDTSGWQLLKSIPVSKGSPQEPLNWLGSSRDGSQMAVSGANQGTLWVIDSSSWKPVVSLLGGIGLNKGDFSPDGQMILVGNNNNSVSVVSLPQKNFAGALKLADSPVLSVAFSPDGTMLLIGDRNGQVRLLAPESMVNREALPGAQPTPVP
jgi:WD40 repeat protein